MAQNGVSGRLTVEKKTVPVGTSEVAVQVTLEENPGISNVRFIFAYPEGFTLKRIQRGDALSTLHFTPPGNLTANPVTPIWDGTEADTSNGVVVTLTFDISDQVKPGDYAVTVSYKKSDLLDGDLNDIDIELVQGGVTIVCPHTDKTEHAAVAADWRRCRCADRRQCSYRCVHLAGCSVCRRCAGADQEKSGSALIGQYNLE